MILLPSKFLFAYFSPMQVTEALAQAGLESSNLIVGIDFTKSNEWTGYIIHALKIYHIESCGCKLCLKLLDKQVNIHSTTAACTTLAMFKIRMNKQSLSLGEHCLHLMKITWSLVLALEMVISYSYFSNNIINLVLCILDVNIYIISKYARPRCL